MASVHLDAKSEVDGYTYRGVLVRRSELTGGTELMRALEAEGWEFVRAILTPILHEGGKYPPPISLLWFRKKIA